MRIITALLGLSVCCSFEATAQGGYHGTEVTETDIANHVGQNIDTNHPVGATAGVADVSDIGAASYSIPIYVAPGTNGMQPQLSITYNSLAGDGVLGYGWTIGGLSSIRRVGRNVYSDDVCLPVQFNDLDRFEIDGQRLVLTSGGPYGADGSRYDTENAQFNMVLAHG